MVVAILLQRTLFNKKCYKVKLLKEGQTQRKLAAECIHGVLKL